MNKQELANKIWESANKMRSKIEANEYKDYILGFIFYKFLSEKEVKFLESQEMSKEDMKQYLTEKDTDTIEWVQAELGYFISYENLFSTWIEKGNDFEISNVTDALSAFDRYISKTHEKLFEKIFETLQTGLSKLGTNAAARTKAARDLIYLIDDIPMDSTQDYDVLGYIYEYLISNFAANAGKKAGEFYTPHEVSVLMSEIIAEYLGDRESIEIYDSTSGSGSLLINIGKSASKYVVDPDNIKYYAQELKMNTYNLTRMNLIMRGILPSNIVVRNGDTLEDDWPYFEESDPIGSYNPLYVDAVVSNPPYSQKWDPEGKETDPRYKMYGVAPKGKADYAFLLHDLYHIKPDGIMTIVLPHGVLFRGGEEGTIRKNLIENDKIDAIIGLPANIFFGTGIPTIIIVLKQKRENNDVLIIDASKGFEKDGKNNRLRACDIRKIADTVSKRIDIDKFSRVVSKEEIRENDYNLNIPRYVDSSEDSETYDIYASMFGGIPKNEIELLSKYWNAFPGLKESVFVSTEAEHTELRNENVKEIIENNEAIKNYRKDFENAFCDFSSLMSEELIYDAENLNPALEEKRLADNIFERLKYMPLIDKYEAYQILDNEWGKIAQDLEIIRTEGYSAVTKVIPNMVTKKKSGIDQEVQDGWMGRILPFELVQRTLLKEENDELMEKEERLSQVTNEKQEIFDSISEEEKSDISEALNNDNTAFVYGELNKLVKAFLNDGDFENYDEDSIEYKSIVSKQLYDEEKALKKQIKEEINNLHMLTKETIESLTEDEANRLIELKWVNPVTEGLDELPEKVIKDLSYKIEALSDKYSETLSDIEKEIEETEKELISLIDQLTGSEEDMLGLEEFKRILGGV